ncbi:IS3 family transposase, partial [Burkholderia sp. Tr-20390]|nr:IS3 family transposase [Burkholderia sp. Tr-20390]
ADIVTTLVRDVRLRQPRLGTRKLHHLLGPALVERGIKLGRDRLFDVLRAARLLVVPRRAYHKTTQSQPLIHHSDRGVQYCSTYYQDIHRRHGLRCSMTDGYDCYQNAL